MSEKKDDGKLVQTRRDFLATTGAVAATAALGISGQAKAAKKKGGTLRFSTRVDGRGLDTHRNIIYYVSNPLTPITQGLIDLNDKMELVPGIAESWDISDDLTQYTFRLRKGVEYHNGRNVDAESVKWNFERIMDPKTSHAFTRASLSEVSAIKVLDPQTLQVSLKAPSAVFLANACYYPVNLMAPDSVDSADTMPIGCGPFKFKSWKRYAKTELVRFENYFETDAEGNQLPYLDGIIGYPKKEDKVRLTALRTGEVDLIENMAYSDVGKFKESQAADFNTWDIPQVGSAYLALQMKEGPFSMKAGKDGKMMRQALAHAIDKDAIHEAVFNGLSEKLDGFYSTSSPWHMDGIENVKEYDPDKSRFILKKLNAENTPVAVVARQAYQYMRQSGELVHAMLLDAGFKATNDVFDNPVLRKKYDKADYNVDSTASSYRFEPDGWYARNILSTGAETKKRTGYVNERADKLITEARATKDFAKRKEMYTEVESIINDDC
nr:ABC transporter substrate-binding protein [Gammaproteobacteria bacterium]